MFKCSECGNIYEIKPEYCDCGNDVFEEELPEKVVDKADDNKKVENVENCQSQIIEGPIRTKNFNPNDNYTTTNKTFTKKTDAMSIAVFCMCILLSILVLFFLWNPKVVETSNPSVEIPKQNNIPSFDKIWKEQPVKPQGITVYRENIPVRQANNIVQNGFMNVIPKVPVQNNIQQNKTVTKAKTPVKTATTSAKPVTNTQKSVQSAATKVNQQVMNKSTLSIANSTTQTNTNTVQNLTKPQAQNVPSQVSTLPQMQAQTTKTQQIVTQTKPAVSSAVLNQEYSDYKIGLRNTIGYKIDFTKVIGDGDCTVSFKISQDGKLINRAFSKQSSNMTLNDAVYNAVMKTPTYKAPPAKYSGETLYLYVKFYSGNYTVTLR
ncbi:MAG: TonB C-terminal domain-containing protein [bacterium]|nr:TonB C-terminal domain-containing protein [bacterium]